MRIEGVIFDLDGVLVSTDEYHYLAWKCIADIEEITFDRELNERLRGVSRMQSLEIILERTEKNYSFEEKEKLAFIKNEVYKWYITRLSPDDILPGGNEFLETLKNKNIKTAVGSSSRNASFILKKIGLMDAFDTVVDGTQINNSKPDPEIFLKAAERLNLLPSKCLVIEDADAGIEAARLGGMLVLGLGSASGNKEATFTAKSLENTDYFTIASIADM